MVSSFDKSPLVKRTRTNEEDQDGDKQNIPSFFVDKVLELDTDQLLVSEGRNNAETTLVKLQEFCERLQGSIEAVNTEQFEAEKKTNEKLAKKMNEEKMKERMKCISDKSCFECKKSVDDVSTLNPCCEYIYNEVSGYGILVCDDCKVKFCKSTCFKCKSFLCNDESSCIGGCFDESCKCTSCEEINCLYCAESAGKSCEDCEDWYCYTCANLTCIKMHDRCYTCNNRQKNNFW